MTTVVIMGIPVKFPFPPYEIQKNYMERVIECLENKQNGVLESPTGTGKTLSLLCASLAWLEAKKSQQQKCQCDCNESSEASLSEEDMCDIEAAMRPSTIIYASRTHSQIYQAMQEMKRTDYRYMKAIVLGSREQMCINQDVINEKDKSLKVNLCKSKVKTKSCLYYTRVERVKEDPEVMEKNIIDMEDILEMGRCHDFCPYYMARELRAKADIIFMPYNYLLDLKTKKLLGIESSGFFNCVIILDEAHNVEKVCEDAVSTQITTADIAHCIEDVTALIDAILDRKIPPQEEITMTPQQLRQLNEMLIKFKQSVDNIQMVQLALEGTCFDGDYIYQMLGKAGMNDRNFNGIIDLIEKIIEFFSNTAVSVLQRSGYCLDLFATLLTIVASNTTPEYKQKIKECFKVHFSDETRQFGGNWFSQPTQQENCRVLSFWCFSPGFAMKMLMDQAIHCLILTSGTLAPLKPLISELEINVGVRIENPHIVKGDQVCVKILSKGPDQEPLNSNFQNRSNPKYLQSLGITISNLVRAIPHGVLIFFPSYFIMEKCQEFWIKSGIWNGINNIKQIFVEPKDKLSFTTAINDYYSRIQDPSCKGAIFMGVCRGKVSEGLDFVDINGRAVLITGLPYPPLKDPKVILKKQYLDFRNSRNKEYLKGDEWYSLEATRAINQAIGRVIRHRHDYGAIILLDSRFANPRIQSNMSLWLQRYIDCPANFGETIRNLRSFFQIAEKNLPPPEPKPKVNEIDLAKCFDDYLDSEDASINKNNTGSMKIYRSGKSVNEIPKKRRK